MPIVPKSVLASYFETGDIPTQSQFATLISSLVGLVDDRYLMGLRQYDPTKPYLAGDSAIYNNSVYQCIVDTTGPFDSSKWQVIASLGSVVYSGTWDAVNNEPPLQSGQGAKGHYYVISNASSDPNDNTDLDGINDWGVTDWAIFNGQVWEKVDNTEAPVKAQNVAFTPACDIVSTNVQDAIGELCSDVDTKLSGKMDKTGTFTSGHLPEFNTTGNLSDSGKSVTDFMPSTSTATNIPFTPTGSITATDVQQAIVQLDDSKMPLVATATDNHIGIFQAGKMADSGFTTGDFLASSTTASTLGFTPFDDITAVNVQDAVESVYTNLNTDLSAKADKVVPSVNGNFAGLDASGNLTDSGKNDSSYLPASTVAANIPSTPSGGISASNVQAALNELDAEKIPVVPAAIDGHFSVFQSGKVIDSGYNPTDFLPSTTDSSTLPFTPFSDITATDVQDAVEEVYNNTNTNLSGKTDKVVPAVNGNFAALNASGNLVDSTKNSSSFLPSSTTAQNIPFVPGGGISSTDVQSAIIELDDDTTNRLSGKADKVVAAVNGNFAALNAAGNLVDSTKNASSFLSSSTTATNIPFTPTGGISSTNVQSAIAEVETDTDTKLSAKMPTVPSATNNRIAVFSSGSVVDSGKLISQYLSTDNTSSYTPTGNYNPATKLYVDQAIAGSGGAVKRILLPFTFDGAYSTTSATFARVPLQVTLPATADIFSSGATSISAILMIDYSTSNSTTEGEFALMEWENSATVTALAGSNKTLGATNGAWVKINSNAFTSVNPFKSFQVLLRRTAGNGNVLIEGATLILTYTP